MHIYQDLIKFGIVILLSLVRFENQLVLKDKTENTVSMKPAKASTAKPNGKHMPRNKTIGIEKAIRLYEI